MTGGGQCMSNAGAFVSYDQIQVQAKESMGCSVISADGVIEGHR